MRLSDSLILENILVSPFSNISKEDKRKASAQKRRRRKKMTIIPSFDESATKSAFRRKLPQVCQVWSKFPSCQSNRLSHYLFAIIIAKNLSFVNPIIWTRRRIV